MRRFVALLATACVFASCHRAEAPGAIADAGVAPTRADPKTLMEVEPNDTLETAEKIDRSVTVSGKIDAVQPATKPDEDWYLIQPAPAPQDLTVALLYGGPLPAEPPTGKFVLEAYDLSHDRIETRTGNLTAGSLASLPALRVRDGVYLRVAGGVFPYLLDIRLAAPDLDAEAEPNNRAVDATPLAFDHPMHGSYATEADQDYYAIELGQDGGASAAIEDAGAPVPAPAADGSVAAFADASIRVPSVAPLAVPTQMLRINVTGIPGIRHSLTLLDEAKTALGTFTSREPGDPLSVRDFALRPGLTRLTLLLETLHPRKKGPAAEPAVAQAYTVTVHREPAPADLELEPNDTLGTATPLVAAAGATARRVGYLAPAGDIDTYRLHLDAPARVHVTLSALDAVDAELSVVEPDPSSSGKTILKVNEGGTKEPEVIPAVTLAAGDHFLRVQAAAHQVGTKWVRDQADPDHTYELAVTIAADDGAFEREPNDTTATATSIVPGQALSGFAFPAKDIDIYRLDLTSQPVATGLDFRLSGMSKVPLELQLRDGKDKGLGELLNSSDPGKPGAEAQFQQKLEPGVYYLVVKPHPASHGAGVPQSDAESPYRLSVQME